MTYYFFLNTFQMLFKVKVRLENQYANAKVSTRLLK